MEQFESPTLLMWRKKRQVLRDTLISIFIISALFFSLLALFEKEPIIYILVLASLVSIFSILKFFDVEVRRYIKVISSLEPEEASLIFSELESENTLSFDKSKLFLTENYIVVLRKTLTIVKYSDIIWLYNEGGKTQTVHYETVRSLNVYTNIHQEFSIFSSPLGKKQEVNLEIFNFILQKNPQILRGITDEILETINMQKKEYKRAFSNK